MGRGRGADVIDGMLAPALIGQDPTNRIGLWQRMFHALYNGNIAVGLGGSAISAVDTALWDITGRALGQPIYNLLGGKVRDRIAVYATGLYYTEGEFPTRLLDEARGYVEAGFMGMKTKVGGLPMDEDVKRVAALREAIRAGRQADGRRQPGVQRDQRDSDRPATRGVRHPLVRGAG